MRENECEKLYHDIFSAYMMIFPSSRGGDRGSGKVSLCCLESSGCSKWSHHRLQTGVQ